MSAPSPDGVSSSRERSGGAGFEAQPGRGAASVPAAAATGTFAATVCLLTSLRTGLPS